MSAEDHSFNFRVGDVVVIERKRRPWRLTTISTIQEDLVTVQGGYLYSLSSGWRLDAAHGKSERITPMTPERMDYLQLMQFQKAMAAFDLTRLPPQRLHRLAELARQFAQAMHAEFVPRETDVS